MGMFRITGGVLSILQVNVPAILLFGLLCVQVPSLLLRDYLFNISFLGFEIIAQHFRFERVIRILERWISSHHTDRIWHAMRNDQVVIHLVTDIIGFQHDILIDGKFLRIDCLPLNGRARVGIRRGFNLASTSPDYNQGIRSQAVEPQAVRIAETQ